jgi:hypothetical protein
MQRQGMRSFFYSAIENYILYNVLINFIDEGLSLILTIVVSIVKVMNSTYSKTSFVDIYSV